uniref:Polysaccharide pyruvyl transferase domain-containing protein n=1 Tax=Thermodesulfobacterium geofontis TaxID=1295609 RepID=A0A7C4JR75_9BACT
MKIFLSGYYGAKNLGDELILLKIIEDILSIIPGAEFFVWSLDKDFTNSFLKDYPVSAVDRFNPKDTVNAIKSSDIVVLGGGGIIQEYYGIKIEDLFKDFGYHVVSYAIPPLLGKIFNKKVFYWCLGHGPVVTKDALFFSRWFYSLADVITLRDEQSYSLVKELLPDAKVFLDTDPLLDFNFQKYSLEKKEKNLLGVSIRKWFNEEEIIEKVGKALRRLVEDQDIRVLLIPCDLSLDLDTTERIKPYLPEKSLFEFEIQGIEDVVRAISLCDWFMGMRLHSLICAYRLGVPFLALSYDVKTEEFAKLVRAQSVKTTELTEDELFFKLKRLINSEPLEGKDFSYKTPEIFKAFINDETLPEEERLKKVGTHNHIPIYFQDFVKTLLQQREELQRKIYTFQQKNEELRAQNEELKSQNEELRAQRDQYFMKLNEIYDSNAWKVVRFYYKLRDTTPLRYLYSLYKPLIDRIFKKSKFYKVKSEEEKRDGKVEKVFRFIEKSEKILIMLSSVSFNPIYNQRPLNLSKQFSKLDYSVLFVSWQWSADEVIPSSYEEVYPKIFQIPMYDFFNLYKNLPFSSKEKIFYISFPVEIFISPMRELRKKGFKIVYDIMDDWDGFKEVGQAPWYKREVEERIILEADFVFAVKKNLSEKFSYLRKDIYILGNAYNEEILGLDAKFIAGTKINNDVVTIGYYGWLSEGRFDWDFVFDVAKTFKEIKIQLIGYALSDKVKEKLEDFKNIEYVGTVNPNELKNFVAKWNIGMIPFNEKDISKGADPLKLYEYIYFGLPTVIKGISDLKERPMVFYINSVEEFGEILKRFNSKDKIRQFQIENRELVEEFLKKNNWKARVDELTGIISKKTFWS